MSSLPAFQDLVPVFHKSEYIQHLEAEVKFCKVCVHKCTCVGASFIPSVLM